MNKRSFFQKFSVLFLGLINFKLTAEPLKNKQYSLYTFYKTKSVDISLIKIKGSKNQILSRVEELFKNEITNEACQFSIILVHNGQDLPVNYNSFGCCQEENSFNWDKYIKSVKLVFDIAEEKL